MFLHYTNKFYVNRYLQITSHLSNLIKDILLEISKSIMIAMVTVDYSYKTERVPVFEYVSSLHVLF